MKYDDLVKRLNVKLEGHHLPALSILGDCLAAITTLQAELEQCRKDAERLNYIEQLATSSRSGVSIEYIKYAEDGYVIETGFRVSSFHNLGDLHKNVRAAIDKAMENHACK